MGLVRGGRVTVDIDFMLGGGSLKPEIWLGDCRKSMRQMAAQSVQTCVTSPPYFGLRDYGHAGQIGLEPTPDEFVAAMVEVFREVRRVLRDDGTVWLNLGDSYAGNGKGVWNVPEERKAKVKECYRPNVDPTRQHNGRSKVNLASKQLIGIPWKVAFALQADGWFLRQDIIWSKPNPMPESVNDRCTKAHEYIFMLSKSKKYYYDNNSIKNPPSDALLKQIAEGYLGSDTKVYDVSGAQSPSGTKARIIENARKKIDKQRGHGRRHAGFNERWDRLSKSEQAALGSNKRSVWTVATKPFRGAHFATFPPDLIEPCILAGAPIGGVVLDPFGGAGTTALVAERHGRRSVLCELNAEYVDIIRDRLGMTPINPIERMLE